MAARKLTAEELAGAEDITPASSARKLSPAELAGAEEIKPDEPGFFRKLGHTIASGAKDLGHVAWDQIPVVAGAVAHPYDTFTDPLNRAQFVQDFALTNPSKRRELERGLSDTVTGGLAQKASEYADEKAHEWFPNASARHMAADQVADDELAAPGYRTAGNVAGMFLNNPFSRGAEFIGKAGGAVAERVAPELVAKGLGYMSKVPSMLKDVGGAVAGYESVAPLTAAIAAPSGHRLEAAKEAAVDPAGLGLSVLGGAAGGAFSRGVLNSKGGKARALIDSNRSGGAKAGLFDPGSGGVFAEELAGLPSDNAGTGRAAQIGSEKIMEDVRARHLAEHGYEYDEGPKLLEQARANRAEAVKAAELESSAVGRDTKGEIRDINEEARVHAHGTAPELLSTIDEHHQIEGSEPYRLLKSQIDYMPESANTRDVAPLVSHLEAVDRYMGTPGDVRNEVRGLLAELDGFRDPQSGAVMIPEWQLNGLRSRLMAMGKVGAENMQAHDMPLAKAGDIARELVNLGPYAPLNRLYAESMTKRAAARQALGLNAKLGNRASEEAMLEARMVRSLKNPVAFPGEGPPEGADMGPYRQRIQDAEARLLATQEAGRAAKAEALANEAGVRGQVSRGEEAAVADRRLLGLNENIAQRAVDENQLRIGLERQVGSSRAAGANKAKPEFLQAYREKYPEQGRNIDLPVLHNARNDLSLRIRPKHGGLAAEAAGAIAPAAAVAVMATKHPALAALLALGQNKDPIMGRALYTPAKLSKPAAIARALGVLRGSQLGQKADIAQKAAAYIELQKQQEQQ